MNVLALKIQKEQRYLYIAMSTLLLLFAVYIYFVSATVMHVVVRKDVSSDISNLHSEISKLEAVYISAQHSVSADIATLEGFIISEDKIFVSRTPSSLALSLATE